MRKDEFSESAKVTDRKGDASKSPSGLSQIRPRIISPHPFAPRPLFAGPVPVAMNIKLLPPELKVVKQSGFSSQKEGKDE